jgi:hypothetical protein
MCAKQYPSYLGCCLPASRSSRNVNEAVHVRFIVMLEAEQNLGIRQYDNDLIVPIVSRHLTMT